MYACPRGDDGNHRISHELLFELSPLERSRAAGWPCPLAVRKFGIERLRLFFEDCAVLFFMKNLVVRLAIVTVASKTLCLT